jgi:hypothetical protein
MMENPNFPSYSPVSEAEAVDLSPVTEALRAVERAVLSKKTVNSVEVNNIDSVKLYLRQELAAVVKAINAIDIPEAPKELKVSNFPTSEKYPEAMEVTNLSELEGLLTRLIRSVESITISPVVNVPAPIVNIPEQQAPIVNIPQQLPPMVDLDISALLAALQPLKLLSRDPNRPITVRMSDGRSFIDAIASVLKDNGERLATVVSTSYGLTKDEYKAASRELNDANNAVNGSVSVGAVSTSVLTARSRISIVLTNDSDEEIYIAKGSTAVMNEGIRLNASGGAMVIDDWGGAISAICASGAKNLCYSETY